VASVNDTLDAQFSKPRIAGLIPKKERNRHKWGGIAFSYVGGFMEAWAQLTLHGIRGGGSVNVLFTVLSQKRSNTAEAVWWTPRGGSAVIALGNSSDQPVRANLSFTSGASQFVDVGPFATEIVRLNSDIHSLAVADRIEAVSINYTGPEGSLIPTGYSSSANGKFASMIRFYDTQHIVQQHLYATNLRIKNARPHMALRNVSTDFVTASPTFLPPNGDADQSVKLPPIKLAPSEVVEVDLDPLLKAASNRSDLDSVSVQVSNTGSAGSLIGALYSLDTQTGVTYDVPLRDSGPPRASTGVYSVRVDGDYTTVVAISNTTDKPGTFTMQINYDGGPYVTGIISVAPGATRTYDIRKLRDDQVPDIYGHTLPRNLGIVQIRWGVRGNMRLNGRAEVVSIKDKVSSSYSCFSCCPPSTGVAYPPMLPAAAALSVGDTVTFVPYEVSYNGPYCGGNSAPYPVGADWWESEHPEVASVIDFGGGLATAVSPGWTSISCGWQVYSWMWDDIDESCDEIEDTAVAASPMEVRPSIGGPHTLWWFRGENPTNYSTSATLTTNFSGTGSYTWEITSGADQIRFDDNSTSKVTSSNQVTVKTIGFGTNENQVGVRVTVNFVSSDTFSMTTRTPYELELVGAPLTQPDPQRVWRTTIYYRIRDQLTTVLPSDVPANENFTTGFIADYPGMNWPSGPPPGAVVPPGALTDVMAPPVLFSGITPVPIYQTPVGSIKVAHDTQDIYIGSIFSAAGRRVQTDLQQFYLDHGAHENVVSPSPNP
jgi:hypothetical protein